MQIKKPVMVSQDRVKWSLGKLMDTEHSNNMRKMVSMDLVLRSKLC